MRCFIINDILYVTVIISIIINLYIIIFLNECEECGQVDISGG